METSIPETIPPENLEGMQASAATLLGTAAVIMRRDGHPRVPLTAVGPFYEAIAAYPSGSEYLLSAAADAARQALKRHLPARSQANGIATVAFPLVGENGAGLALVLFLSPGVRPDLRPALAADLGLPPGALPATDPPLDANRITITLRFIEQALAMVAHATGGKAEADPEVKRYRILYAAARDLAVAQDEDSVLRVAAESLAGLLHMDRAMPYLPTEDAWAPRIGVSYWGEPDISPAPLELSDAAEDVLRQGKTATLPSPDLPHGQRVVVPILQGPKGNRTLAAVIALETSHITRTNVPDVDMALLVARQAALALSNAHNAAVEKTMAEKLQETLQSHFDASALPHLRVEEFYRPAAQDANVGGDFYDVFALPDGRAVVLVGDVAGKGVDAAIHTNLARYTLRAYALLHDDPAEVLRLANEALARYKEFRDFLTIALVILDPRSGQLTYASAGHCPIFLYRHAADAIGTLESTGTLLGMMTGLRWRSETHKWSPGDALLLYTDGISEAHTTGSQELFETTRVRDLFAANRHAPPRAVLDAIFNAAEEFSSGIMHDDCAMLLVTQPEG